MLYTFYSTQSTADNSMEWEYVEPINIINTVRK